MKKIATITMYLEDGAEVPQQWFADRLKRSQERSGDDRLDHGAEERPLDPDHADREDQP